MKKEKGEKLQRVTNEDLQKAITEGFDKLITVLSESRKTFPAMMGPISSQQASSTMGSLPLNPVTTSSSSLYPVPVEFRDIIDTVLNKKFGTEIVYLPETTSFQFSILVPKEYSNASEAHWSIQKEDRRSKVIENALGVNGVRDWATKVYENLSVEAKSKIFYDRTQPL